MTLNCVIIDDEPLAAELLASYVEKVDFLHLQGAFNSATEAIKTVREKKIDLIFLDIQMPELSGLEFARIIDEETRIVFTTAFSQYAIDGYKVNALDYLLKPISFERFMEVANKALSWFESRNRMLSMKNDRFIFIKSEYKLQKVDFDDILYVEGVKDYVKFYLKDGNVMSLMNMKKVEEFLPKPEFMRIHRSYIVHMSKVDMIDRFRFVIGSEYLPVSESYKETVQKYIEDHTLF